MMELDSEYLKKISSLENRLRAPQQMVTPPPSKQVSILKFTEKERIPNYTEKQNITIKKIENFEPIDQSSKHFLNTLKRKLTIDQTSHEQQLCKKIKLDENSNSSDSIVNMNFSNNKKITDFFKTKFSPHKEEYGFEILNDSDQKIQDSKLGCSQCESIQNLNNYLKQKIIEKDNLIKDKDKNYTEYLQKNLIIEKDQQQRHQIYVENIQLILCETLLEKEKQIRNQSKYNIQMQKFRLGEFKLIREGTKFSEMWIDGTEIKQIKEKLTQVQQQKDELEKQKKQLKQFKKCDKQNVVIQSDKKYIQTDLKLYTECNSDSNSNNSIFQDNTVEQINKIQFQLNILAKEEQYAGQQLEKLIIDKNYYIRQLKKFQEEESCLFSKPQKEPFIQAWPLLNKRYQILSLLGKGGYSEVYKAFDLQQLKPVACKVHQLNNNWGLSQRDSYIKHACRENEIHQELNHRNIVKDFDTIDIDAHIFCTILEYCEGPDLAQYLQQHKYLIEKEAKSIIKKILMGIKYLHEHKMKIIHYDLKPQNIIFHEGEIKITDFGLCKVMDHDQSQIELTSQGNSDFQIKGVGTYWYLPPECFEKNSKINNKVDIWSIGVIFFEIIFGQKPFGHNMSQNKILLENIILKSTQVQFPSKPSVSNECKDFIRNCLKYNQEERYDILQALNCSYFKKI